MTQDEIVEAAVLGHASTRDAIKWAMAQEREECEKVCEQVAKTCSINTYPAALECASAIHQRNKK